MSLIDRMRAFLAPTLVKASEVAALFARYNLATAKWSPDNFGSYAKEGYGKNPVVYRCVSILSRSLGAVPWNLTRGTGKAAVEIDDPKHPLRKLLKRPNPLQGGASFFEAVAAYYLLKGDAYIEGVSPETGPPLELYTHRPDRIEILADGIIGNMPGVYVYRYNGGEKRWQMDPVDGTGPILHWKTFNPNDDWYGQGVIKAAACAADQHNDSSAWNAALLQNGAAPSGGFRYAPQGAVGGTLTEPQRKQLRKDLEERLQGPQNARRPLILDGGLDWVDIGMTPLEMDWLKGKSSNALDICAVFGVPGQVYGIPDAQTFANYEQARLAMYEEMVIPLHDTLCDELNRWLVSLFGEDLTLKGDWDDVDALAVKRAAQWERVQNADWLTLNEKREATCYEPIKDAMADQIFVDAGKVPLAASGDTAAPIDPNAAPQLDANGDPIPVDPNAPPAKPVDAAPLPPVDGSGNAAPADSVQSAGLNGTQVTALQTILDDVATGGMSPDAAVIMILLAFPTFDPVRVQEMVDAQDSFEPTPPPAPVGPDGQPLAPAAGPGAPVAGGKPTKKPGKTPAGIPPKAPAKSDAEALVEELKAEGFKDDAALALVKLAYGDA